MNPPPGLESEADEAIERYSRIPIWREGLSQPCLELLMDRLMFARQICHVRRAESDPPESFPELFCWLMIECWNLRHAEWAAEVYLKPPADGA